MQAFDEAKFRDVDRTVSDLKADRQRYEGDWREIAELVAPGKAWDEHETRNSDRHRAQAYTRLFDTTAIDASDRMAAAFGHLLFNKGTSWFQYGLDDPDLAARPLEHAWLQRERDRALSVLAMPETKSYTALNETVDELCDFGTGVLFLGDDQRRMFRPIARPLSECWIAEDEAGTVDTLCREYRMPAWRAVREFGDRAVQAKKHMEQDRPNECVTIRHVVEPRDAAKMRPGSIKRTELAFASVYFEVESKSTLREGGFRRFPYAVPRISKAAGSCYGRPPAFKHLGAIRTINAVARAKLRITQKVAEPPLIAPDDGVLGKRINTMPGGVTFVRRGMGKDQGPRPLQTGANPVAADELQQQLADQLRRAFYIDLLELPMLDRMTATEVASRQSASLAVLNPITERMETELLMPVTLAVFDWMRRMGATSPAPESIRGRPLRVGYVGQLAMSRVASRVTDIQRWLTGVVAQVAQFDPEVLDAVDTDAIVRSAARDLGIPTDSIRPGEVVEAVRRMRSEQQQQQQAVEQTAVTAGALRDGAAASKDLGLTRVGGAA
jgi:hypothetical protein